MHGPAGPNDRAVGGRAAPRSWRSYPDEPAAVGLLILWSTPQWELAVGKAALGGDSQWELEPGDGGNLRQQWEQWELFSKSIYREKSLTKKHMFPARAKKYVFGKT